MNYQACSSVSGPGRQPLEEIASGQSTSPKQAQYKVLFTSLLATDPSNK